MRPRHVRELSDDLTSVIDAHRLGGKRTRGINRREAAAAVEEAVRPYAGKAGNLTGGVDARRGSSAAFSVAEFW